MEHANAAGKSRKESDELNIPCVNNLWIPDGFRIFRGQDYQASLKNPLMKSSVKRYDGKWLVDSVESKLFSIGSRKLCWPDPRVLYGVCDEP